MRLPILFINLLQTNSHMLLAGKGEHQVVSQLIAANYLFSDTFVRRKATAELFSKQLDNICSMIRM